MVSECGIAFGNIHFLGKLIPFMYFYRHYNFNLRVFLHFFHEILRFTAYIDRNFELFTNHSPGHVMMSHPKWRSTDRLSENIHFLSDYRIPTGVYAFPFHNSFSIYVHPLGGGHIIFAFSAVRHGGNCFIDE